MDLPDDIVKRIKVLLKFMGVKNISTDEINSKWIKLYDNEEEIDKLYKTINKVKDILKSEIKWVKEMSGEGCEKWAVISTLDGYYYGSVIVFYNSKSSIGLKGKEGVSIQEINKSIPALIMSELYPNLGKKLPKLNTVLESGIIGVAKYVGMNYIYVKPYLNQASILEKYYGYNQVNRYGYLYTEISNRTYHEESDKPLKWPCNYKFSGLPWMMEKIN